MRNSKNRPGNSEPVVKRYSYYWICHLILSEIWRSHQFRRPITISRCWWSSQWWYYRLWSWPCQVSFLILTFKELFLAYEATVFGISIIWPTLVIGAIFSIYLQLTLSPDKLPKYIWLLSFINFASACYWIYLVSNVLMDFLQLIGLLSSLNPTFLGLTFLAFGNSLADYFNDVAMAKMGYGIMAVTGCFAG